MLRPAKFLLVNIPSLAGVGFRDIPPFGSMPYQWETTLAVTAQPHSSSETTNPYFYDGNDIVVGDTIFSCGLGRVLKIASISVQSSISVTCVVEDVDSENALSDQTQNADGALPTGDGYLFSVVDGMPVIYPVPDVLLGVLPQYFAASILGRFLGKVPEVFSRGGTLANSTGVETGNIVVWYAPFACTVTAVRGYRTGGTGATINARKNGTSNHLATALSLTSADTWMIGGTVQNASYAAGDKLEIMAVTVTGIVTQLAIQVEFTRP